MLRSYGVEHIKQDYRQVSLPFFRSKNSDRSYYVYTPNGISEKDQFFQLLSIHPDSAYPYILRDQLLIH